VFRSRRGQDFRPVRDWKWVAIPAVAALMLSAAHWCMARSPQEAGQAPGNQAPGNQAPGKGGNPYHKTEDDDRPKAVPPFNLDQVLKTVPVARDKPRYNYEMVDASLQPRDKKGIWVLDISFKPLRIRTVEIPGKGRRQIFYLYYKVVNRTGQPRMFAPQFVMVNEKGQRLEDEVIPEAIPIIQGREDRTIPVLGAVDVIGVIPPSTKPNVDDAVFGAACWDRWDPKADRFSIYVRGLSDGYVEVPAESGGKPTARHKTLRIDFIRHGDERNLSEKEFQLADPPYAWVYW
jgi:hypothetical protein